jgi:hypothetical protein
MSTTGSHIKLPQTPPFQSSQLQNLTNFVAGWSTWQYAVSLILGLVVYDQGETF